MIRILTATLLLATTTMATPAPTAPALPESYRSLVRHSETALDEGRYEDAIIAIDACRGSLKN